MILVKNRKIKVILFFLLTVLAVSGVFLWKSNIENGSNKIKIITTLFPYYDFVKIIGGDMVEVSLLLPLGVEAHTFEPKPSDIFKINSADIFVYTGDFMEPWAKDILASVNNEELIIVGVGGIGNLLSGSKERSNSSIDPHIWLDFSNSQLIADDILSAIIKKDPQNSSFYIKNADVLKKELGDLDNSFKIGLLSCRTRTLVYGGHYAFGYLVKKYDLNYLAAQGLAPDSEPTVRDLAGLINELKKDNIRYVFYEELSSPKIAETISRETGAKLLLLNAAHNITKEDLDNKVSFIDIMNNNLVNLKIGLGPCLDQ